MAMVLTVKKLKDRDPQRMAGTSMHLENWEGSWTQFRTFGIECATRLPTSSSSRCLRQASYGCLRSPNSKLRSAPNTPPSAIITGTNHISRHWG